VAPALTIVKRSFPDPDPTGTILVVDDGDGVRRAVSRVLSRFGFDTIEAVDGIDGVARFREH